MLLHRVTAIFLLLLISASGGAATWHYVSLKGKTDAELLAILTNGKDADQEKQEAVVLTHLPDRFWELPPKEAALALLRANRTPRNYKAANIRLDLSKPAAPPESGEIGFDWRINTSAERRAAGVTLLRCGVSEALLSFSEVEIVGQSTEEEIQAAIQETHTLQVPASLAQHVYATVWWLGRVPKTDFGEMIMSSHDGSAKFWITPSQPAPEEVSLYPFAISERWTDGYDSGIRANFAWFVLRRLMEDKLGIPRFDPQARKVGKPREVSSAEQLVHRTTSPDPRNENATREWVTALLQVLADSAGEFHSYAIMNLVPQSDPRRYEDARINEMLLRVARAGTTSVPPEMGADWQFSDACWAGHALAQRGDPESFAILMQLLDKKQITTWSHGHETALEGASLMALRHPEMRALLLPYVQAQVENVRTSRLSVDSIFAAVWTGSFIELTPLLQKLATSSSAEIATTRASMFAADRSRKGRFHQARHILTAWQEEDARTKLKLSAIVEACTYREVGIPNPLRDGFDALSKDQQQEVLHFLDWLAAQPSATTRGEHASKLRAQLAEVVSASAIR